MKKRLLLLAAALLSSLLMGAAPVKQYTLASPDGALQLTVSAGEGLQYSLSREGTPLLEASEIGLTLSDGTALGGKVRKAVRASVDRTVDAAVYKSAQVRDRYNALTLKYKGFDVEFCVYDGGAAYRIVPTVKGAFQVKGEKALFRFPQDYQAWIPYINKNQNFSTSFESQYEVSPLSGFQKGKLAFLPVLVNEGACKVLLTESGLTNYPGMFLDNPAGDASVQGVFAPVPRKWFQGGHHMLQLCVEEREDFIASFDQAEPLPWRIALVATDDGQLLETDIPWLLGAEPQGDFSWVRPGKVAWDWWNDWNLYRVPFQAGINNETYKYYIDFAASQGIEYVILDEGWAVNLQADLFQVVPEIDIQELVDYGARRGVGIILWAGYWAFNREMEKVCKYYSELGVKGFKVDFMNLDDQLMVQFYTRAAATAARYGLLLDFHGAFKPAGLQRTWPNVVNFEGVFGLENMKWAPAEVDQVTYDVEIPFIRNVAGPMDYTQGAMRNATRSNYRPVNNEPMSQGTRCRQLAEYTVFFAPLTMLCDSPSNYLAEPECTAFIASVPTVWDETVALPGNQAGQCVVVARRSGDTWYVGAMNAWEPCTLQLDLSFLGEGSWQMEIFMDGPNAAKAARDYVRAEQPVPADRIVWARLAPGGGWTARIKVNK